MSLKVVPFKSLDAVSYSPSIVTMAISVAVCDIFNVKEWPDLENRVRVRSRSLEMAPIDRSSCEDNVFTKFGDSFYSYGKICAGAL